MPKYTKLLPQGEYDKLTLEEKAVYIGDMADHLRLPGEPPALTDRQPSDDKPKTR